MANKSVTQIKKIILTLKKKLSKKKVYENFGDKEIRQLQEFVGNAYDYPYEIRLEIQKITNEFSNWCYHFSG
uniref:Uncharacterized protein n=1 Tax=viral metagenome TaxID=1070528 RepID=A0A6M3LWQ1_9ZZZZ